MKLTKFLAALLILCLMLTMFVACDSDYSPNSSQVNNGNHEQKIDEEPENTMTLGQKNALKKAESYLKYSAFSKQGLIDQLEFEGFEQDDILFAVDNVKVDWKEECYDKAMSYLEFSSFSKQGLIDQLEFEGFTADQIEYAIEKVGY